MDIEQAGPRMKTRPVAKAMVEEKIRIIDLDLSSYAAVRAKKDPCASERVTSCISAQDDRESDREKGCSARRVDLALAQVQLRFPSSMVALLKEPALVHPPLADLGQQLVR
jgi:hypothetical protein